MRRILLLSFSLCAMLVVGELRAQDRLITGKVVGDDGSPLPGVNVVVKGTTVGAMTDAQGEYRLNVPGQGGVLVFSFIGQKSKEVEIGSQSAIDVRMQPDATQLSEVIVTAFGIERSKDEVTYAAKNVKGEDLVIAQQTRAGQGLVGKIAGLQINVQSNGVNPSNQILLRGLRSISQNNSALIVIDGVIASQGAFDALNPNDIANIDVLLGATAAALYGANASNGALIVTTKIGGSSNRFTVGLNSTYRFEEVAYMPDFQTKHGIGWAGQYDPIENTNWGPRYDGITRQIGPTFPDGTYQEVPYAPIEDNLKDFYNTGKTAQNTVYITGGNDNAKFYLSAGNQKTTGIIPDDKYQRTTFRINATQKIGKLALSVNSSYFKDKTDVVGNTIGDQDRPLYWFILNVAGNIPLTSYKDWRNPDSYAHADNYYNAYYQNPYWAIGTNRDIESSSRLNGNFSATYDFSPKISWTTRIGVNTASGKGKDWRARQEYDEDLQPAASAVSSFVEDSEFQNIDFNGQSILNGNFNFSEKVALKAILGTQFTQGEYRESTLRANNLSIPDFYDISNGTGELVGKVDQEEKRTAGVFADLTFGYASWVYLQMTGRQDWTSTLRKGENSYFYPAAGLSIVLSEGIDAIKNSNVISYAKITASNSTVYNDLRPYRINETFTRHAAFPMGDVSGFTVSTTAVDPNIKKEKLNTMEFSGQLGLLNDRINLQASYFNTKTTNLITSTTPSTASSANFFLTNIGELQGKGIELSLGGTIIDGENLKWRANIHYTANETVVKSIKDDLKEITIDSYTSYGTYAIVGMPFPQLKAASYVRDPQGRVVVSASDGNPIVGDVLPMGKTTPDYILSGTSSITWKGFTLAGTFDYRTGHVYYEQGSDQMEFTGRSIASVSSNRQDFVWPNSVIKTGENTYEPNTALPITGGQMLFWQNTYNEIKENYVKDATAFKIREVALNYTFPQRMLSATKVINKLTLGFVATNVLTFLPEENRFADPEFNNVTLGVGEAGYSANSIGVGGYLQGPPTRTYGFNLNIEF